MQLDILPSTCCPVRINQLCCFGNICVCELLAWITVFTWVQDVSNLRWPPKMKHLLRKNISVLILYTFYMKHIKCSQPLAVSVTVSIFTVSAFIFLALTPNIPILFTAISQHIIISPIHCTGYTALLRTLHSRFWWTALPCCYDSHWLNHTCTSLVL